MAAGLNVNELEKQLKQCFSDVFPTAFEQAFLAVMPNETKDGHDKAKIFGEKLDNMMSEMLSKSIAAAIDYYVKCMVIDAQIILPGPQGALQAGPFPVTGTIMLNPTKLNAGNPTAGALSSAGFAGIYQ